MRHFMGTQRYAFTCHPSDWQGLLRCVVLKTKQRSDHLHPLPRREGGLPERRTSKGSNAIACLAWQIGRVTGQCFTPVPLCSQTKAPYKGFPDCHTTWFVHGFVSRYCVSEFDWNYYGKLCCILLIVWNLWHENVVSGIKVNFVCNIFATAFFLFPFC